MLGSRERSHIPPWEKETSSSNMPLGFDILVPLVFGYSVYPSQGIRVKKNPCRPTATEGKKEKRWWPCDIRRNFSDRWTFTKSGVLEGLRFDRQSLHGCRYTCGVKALSDSQKYSQKNKIAWQRWMGFKI